jgi:hypothetical protein
VEDGGLAEAEARQFKQDLEDVARKTVRAEVAALRMKRLMGKFGKGTISAMERVTVNLISEALKQQIW